MKSYLIRNSYFDKLGFALLIGALVVYPYLFVFNMFYTSTLSIGKNTYVALISIVIISCFSLRWKVTLSKFGVGTVYFIMLLALLIIIIRTWVHAEGVNIFLYRIILMPIIYCGVAYSYLMKRGGKELVGKIIFWNCLIQAIIGIVNHYFFSHILTGSEAYIGANEFYKIVEVGTGGQREPGILLSSSLYANFILLGVFLLVSSCRTWKLPRLFEYILLLVLVWGIWLSGSRWPFLGSMLFLVLYFKRLPSLKKITFIPIIILAGFFLQEYFMSIIRRLVTEGTTVRLSKYSIALSALFENSSNFLFGPSLNRMGMSVNGITFSDNSFLTLMITFGIPLTFLFLLFFMYLMQRTISLKGNHFLLFCFLGTLFLTNSILWDMWLFYFFATLYSLQPEFQSKPAGIGYSKPIVPIKLIKT